MWLTVDERRILTGYYRLIKTVDDESVFQIDDLEPLLKTYANCSQIKEYEYADSDSPATSVQELKAQIAKHLQSSNRISNANSLLAARQLITIKNHQHANGVVIVTLTLAGYDLGRKYASWWTRTGLCFSEYKDHWLWLIVGFIGGILGSLVLKGIEILLFPRE